MINKKLLNLIKYYRKKLKKLIKKKAKIFIYLLEILASFLYF